MHVDWGRGMNEEDKVVLQNSFALPEKLRERGRDAYICKYKVLPSFYAHLRLN